LRITEKYSISSGDNLPSLDKPADSYPAVETQESGHRVLIVQASAYTKYVGDITLYFDDKGIVQHFEGEPIFMGPNVVPDPEVLREIQPWKEVIDISGKRIIGSLKMTASGSRCYQSECLMGTIQAESMAFAAREYEPKDEGWTYATIALTNPGGVRGSLSPGDLTFSDLVTTTPFENTIDSLEIEGKYIREALEHSARFDSPSILQVAGLRIVFDMKKPPYSRIVKLEALCRICDIPRYEPLQDNAWYRIVINGFLLVNGDNFAMLRDNARNHQIRQIDIDALVDYVEKNSPIAVVTPRGRITFV
jgi:5'-nucleotidase